MRNRPDDDTPLHATAGILLVESQSPRTVPYHRRRRPILRMMTFGLLHKTSRYGSNTAAADARVLKCTTALLAARCSIYILSIICLCVVVMRSVASVCVCVCVCLCLSVMFVF